MKPSPEFTIIIPTHRPDPGRLQRTLAGLSAQTLPPQCWETVLVDNASQPALAAAALPGPVPANLRVVAESRLGLSYARIRGFHEARGAAAVLVDDDNVLAPDFLRHALDLLAAHPRVGLMGGPSRPEFQAEPPAWTREFLPLLALRDLGHAPLISSGLRRPGAAHNEYPSFAPIGAGMVIRRPAWEAWLQSGDPSGLTDRRGPELTSAGDNDIVLRAMRAGWEVGYFPDLALVHLIPPARLQRDYLARLNYGIQKSWMQVLARHDASPWPALTRTGTAVRKAKAWITHRAWSSPAAHIRWRGACGHFEGRVVNS